MEKTVKILAILLGIQVVLALTLNLGEPRVSGGAQPGPLLDADTAQVDRIQVTGAEANVVLVRGEEGWTLPAADNFPANAQRVETLLDRLANLETAAPVAQSEKARERFQVAEADFERKVVLSGDEETLATLYLGSSPGPRRVHVRVDGENPIHEVELALHDVPAAAADWQDQSVLQFPPDSIQRMQVAGLTLERISGAPETASGGDPEDSSAAAATAGADASGEAPGPQWRAEELAGDETLDVEAVDTLASAVANLQTGEALGTEAQPEYGLEEPALTLSVQRGEDETVEYLLGKGDKDNFFLKASTRPEYFSLPGFRATPLLDAAKREQLLEVASD